MTTSIPIKLRLRKGSPECGALVDAWNQGIDAHLQAIVHSRHEDCGSTLEVDIDERDIPVLIRRLTEAGTPESLRLADSINRRAAIRLDEFTMAYIVAALWTEIDDDGNPLEDNFGPEDIAPEALASIAEDCRKFQAEHGVPEYNDSRYSDAEKAGHDFWLTRNEHGCGFWDRSELPPEIGRKYTQAARSFGRSDIYVGDDGLIYVT